MYLYTKRGLYHEKHNELSGDIVRGVDNGQFAILVLADGISACSHGAEGANIVSSLALDYIQEQYAKLRFLPEKWAYALLKLIQGRLLSYSERQGEPYKEYSSTLMALLIDRERDILHYCNIGDGLLMKIEKEMCPIISMPQGTIDCCPAVTTKGAEKIMETGKAELKGIHNILMCTDGAWRRMYQQNVIKPDIKKALVSGNFESFREFIRTSDNMDDCSFAIVDTRKAS